MKQWTCSLLLQIYWRCHESLPVQSPVVAQEKTYNWASCDILWEGTAGIWDAWSQCYEPTGRQGCALSLDSSVSWVWWLHFCFLLMMLFCWLHHTLTSSVCVKHWGWKSEAMVLETSRLPPLFCCSFISPSTFEPSHSHELWLVTKRMRLRIKWVSFTGSEELRHLVGSQSISTTPLHWKLMWFGRLVKMPSGHFPVEVCWVCPTGRIL